MIKSIIVVLLIGSVSSFPAFASTPTLLQCDINNDGIINTSDKDNSIDEVELI